jgi:hypothetical protein
MKIVFLLITIFLMSIFFIIPLVGFFAGFNTILLDEEKYGVEGAALIDGR